MMKNGLEEIIGDLLLRHNCVIIPSFGGFVARRISARIDHSRGLIAPPSKGILFNPQLINNDGLLLNEYAQRSDISYEEASNRISEWVDSWNRSLNAGHRVEIERVGILYTDNENKICFEQDRFFNLLLESFGLGNVSFVAEQEVFVRAAERTAINSEVSEATEAKVIELKPDALVTPAEEKEDLTVITPQRIDKGRRPVWKYVAAACTLPILFYAVWIPVRTDVLESGVLSVKDFNPFYERAEGSYTDEPLKGEVQIIEEQTSLEEEVKGLEGGYYTYRVDGANFIPVDLGRKVQSEEIDTESAAAPETTFRPNAMNYIVGCFSNETNAINLVAKLKSLGFSAKIVDVHNGLHRVSAGEAISVESLGEIRSKAASSGFNGWILN